jgi:uncharacterized cupin superfamily protein
MMDLHARTLDEFGELLRHEGEEYAFVLEGEVMLHTDIYAPLSLKAGESIYFDSSVGHAFLNAGSGNARILNIASHVLDSSEVSTLAAQHLVSMAAPRSPAGARAGARPKALPKRKPRA